jgi:pectate lyase
MSMKRFRKLCVAAGLLAAGWAQGAGYEGFGATAGGDWFGVVKVTSLADKGPGTLREAVQKGGRRIVFTKSGTVTLKKTLKINQPNLTIDGLNAAITITGAPVAIEATHDVIVRFIRFRKSPDDGLRIAGACRRIVVDHCSLTGAGDGALDITIDYDQPKQRPADITVSWCILAGTKKAMLISNADNISLHHNLFLDNEMRNPQLHDVRDFDFRNNVVHRWGVYGLRARAGSTGNVMHNFFGPGANPRKNQKLALVLMGKPETKSPAGPIHVAGNLGPGKLNLNITSTAPKALHAPAVTLWAAAEAYRKIIQHVGARPLDKVDEALLKGL